VLIKRLVCIALSSLLILSSFAWAAPAELPALDEKPEFIVEASTKIMGEKPFSNAAEKAQVYRIYGYYQQESFDDLDEDADAFLKTYPNSKWTDYVLYMKALALSHPKNNFFQRLFHVDDARHDVVDDYQEAYTTLQRLARAYPQSRYAEPALQKMRVIRNKLAEKLFDRAKDNAAQQAYIASANRATALLLQYPHVPQTQKAIDLLRQDYKMLGLSSEAKRLSILKAGPCIAPAH
jgi:outer membrane protein assembly factor BamD